MPLRDEDRVTLVDLADCQCPPKRSIAERFPAAATGAPPTDKQRTSVALLQSWARSFAEVIDGTVPDGRDKELALTHLEDVLMRANRGVFTAPPATGFKFDGRTPHEMVHMCSVVGAKSIP